MPRRIIKRATLRDYLVVTGLSLLIVWFSYLVFGIARKEEIARHTVSDTRAQLQALTLRKDTLKRDLDELATDRGKEASFRQDFGVAKPGEDVIIVVPAKQVIPPPELTWWEKTRQFFGF